MAVADIKKTKNTRTKKSAEKKRKERRERRNNEKRDRNIAATLGKAKKTRGISRLRYRVILTQTGKPGKPKADITGLVTSVSWDEESVTLTGQMSVRAPHQMEKRDIGFTVNDGNIVRLDCYYGGKWRVVWQMRVRSPNDNVGTREGAFALVDDSALAGASKGDFKYKREKKKRPKGWKCHQIVIDVCREYKIPLGHIAKGTKDITDLVMNDASPLEVIAAAYKQEREYTGTRFVFHWRSGKLHITKLRRNAALLALKEQITSATVTRSRGDKFFTAMDLTASLKDGKRKHKKIEATIVAGGPARRYGLIRIKHRLEKKVKSRAEMVTIGKRIMARSIKKKTRPTISLSHRGVPWIRRGDAIFVNLPEYGFTPKPRSVPPFKGGSYNLLFIKEAHHTIDSGGHMMDLEFQTDDPVAEQAQEQREARDKRRREQKSKDRKAKKKVNA